MATPHIILFENDREGGAHVHVVGPIVDLTRLNFDNKTSSIVVVEGTWDLFGGEEYGRSNKTPNTVTLTPTGGNHDTGLYFTSDLEDAGLANDDLSSLRPR